MSSSQQNPDDWLAEAAFWRWPFERQAAGIIAIILISVPFGIPALLAILHSLRIVSSMLGF